jgi:hypothetical protein
MADPIKWLQRRLSKDTQAGEIYETISNKKSEKLNYRTSDYEISQELSWYDWGKNWWTWIKNKNDSLYDYWFPIEKRVLDIPHPRDRYKVEIQKEQRLKQQQRERNREERAQLLHEVFEKDIATLQSKQTLCQNWYDHNSQEIRAAYMRDKALTPPLLMTPEELKKVPGWYVDVTKSRIPRMIHPNLCETLDCSLELNKAVIEDCCAENRRSFNNLIDLQEKLLISRANYAQCEADNAQLQSRNEGLHKECKAYIKEKTAELVTVRPEIVTLDPVTSQNSMTIELNPTMEPLQVENYSNLDKSIPVESIVQIERFWTGLLRTFVIPIRLLFDKKSPVWEGNPAGFWVRNITGITVIISILWVAIYLGNMVYFCLQNVITLYYKNKAKSKLEEKEEDSNDALNLLRKLRGGSLESIDPVFILIHLEKFKLENPIKTRPRLPLRFFGIPALAALPVIIGIGFMVTSLSGVPTPDWLRVVRKNVVLPSLLPISPLNLDSVDKVVMEVVEPNSGLNGTGISKKLMTLGELESKSVGANTKPLRNLAKLYKLQRNQVGSLDKLTEINSVELVDKVIKTAQKIKV